MSTSTIHRQVRVRTRMVARDLRRALRSARRIRDAAATGARALAATQVPRFARLLKAAARIAVIVVVASVLLASGAFAASQLYGQFGGGRAAVNAGTWAERTVRYQPATCAACHRPESLAAAAGFHATVRCETCHGPLGGHPGTAGARIALAAATSEACVTCHTSTAGRPATFAQVDLADHYRNADCIRCHDPHAVVAAAPPDVTHPLTDLPACTTCHAPNGLKKVPAGHELVADAVCLTCHAVANDER